MSDAEKLRQILGMDHIVASPDVRDAILAAEPTMANVIAASPLLEPGTMLGINDPPPPVLDVTTPAYATDDILSWSRIMWPRLWEQL